MTRTEGTSSAAAGRIVVGSRWFPTLAAGAEVGSDNKLNSPTPRLLAVATWEFPRSFGHSISWSEDTIDFAADASGCSRSRSARRSAPSPPRRWSVRSSGATPRRGSKNCPHDTQMIVVGSRGHGELAGLLLGSVSEHLAADGRCPIVVIHSADGDEAGNPGEPIRRLLSEPATRSGSVAPDPGTCSAAGS